MCSYSTPRRAIVAVLIAILAVSAAPGAALAARGDGPYTPFPDRPDNRAQDYVNKLNQQGGGTGGAPAVTAGQLAKGVTSDPGGKGTSGSTGAGKGARARTATRSKDRVGSAAAPFKRAGFSPASAPPDPSVVPFLALGGLLGVTAVGVGVYRVRRRWAA